MDRHVCVHGHFYQPPRENPWLESIELQDSAYPYHDWNERITAECYGPNARSRILDGEGRVAALVNNYARISFNVGPTLLAWMEVKTPDVYDAVVRADRESAERFGGHGSALAQVYNHVILPLASERDRVTQVRWGLRDFEHRFGRPATGMWLPETAADTASLEVLAAEGVQFAVLAPHQAARVRPLHGTGGQRKWHDVGEGGVDTTVPYLAPLPSGRSIVVFFYDGPLSRAVAFERLLSDGNRFAERLLAAFPEGADGPRLAHIATDGETYGHHHRHGDMALAYALQRVEETEGATLTNYGQFLEVRPPEHEVQIAELTSWSCAHGVERWRSDCGCNTGRGWSQRWRAPLREALDHLRGELDPVFEERGGALLADPWAARDDYVDVVLDRTPERVAKFVDRHASHPLDEGERIDVLKLLEMQRHAMLMYTSCGWFFDDLSGIETVQVLQYAARAIQLGEELAGRPLEEAFLEHLDRAESNVAQYGRGRAVYDRFVRPAMVDLTKVGAHWAATTLVGDDERAPLSGTTEPLFRGYTDRERVYCYEIDREDVRVRDAGAVRLSVGRVRVTSEVTRESALVSFGAVYLGDHNLNVGARPFLGDDAYREMVADVSEAFDQGDLPEVVRRIDRHFDDQHYSLRTLFRDEQRELLDRILSATLEESAEAQRRLYEREIPLIRFLAGINVPVPRSFLATAEVVVDAELGRQFADVDCDVDLVRDTLDDTADWGLELDVARHAYEFARTLGKAADRLRRRPTDGSRAERLEALVDLAASLPWDVDVWQAQDSFYEVLHDQHRRLAERGDPRAELFARLAGKLDLALPA